MWQIADNNMAVIAAMTDGEVLVINVEDRTLNNINDMKLKDIDEKYIYIVNETDPEMKEEKAISAEEKSTKTEECVPVVEKPSKKPGNYSDEQIEEWIRLIKVEGCTYARVGELNNVAQSTVSNNIRKYIDRIMEDMDLGKLKSLMRAHWKNKDLAYEFRLSESTIQLIVERM